MDRYTAKYDKRNHVFEIMDTQTKRGIALILIAEEMAAFLFKLVEAANENTPNGGDNHAEG